MNWNQTVKPLRTGLIFSLFLLSQVVAFAQSLTIEFAEHRFRIDPFNGIIVVQSDSIENYTDLTQYESIDVNLLTSTYHFEEVPDHLSYTDSYLVTKNSNEYHLFFTRLPLLRIQSQGYIPDEPKIPAEFIYADNSQILIATIGIERRGGISQSYPKKTYDLEFWEDAETETSIDVQFGNLRSDDDWVLDGMYNEPLRLRAHTASELWLDIHQPYYQDQEPDARSGADNMYVELFLNGHYNGVYLLSEQIDRKLVQIKKFNGSIRGEMYKGKHWGDAVSFVSAPAYDNSDRFWGGYVMKYPKEADTTNWENVYNFVDYVVNSSDEDFENVWSKFNFDNYMDYFIFLNLMRATDNTGKNIYLTRYDSAAPYFYVPWDLDGCFGTWWDGTNLNITDDILTNGFMDRVIDTDVGNYKEQIDARWAELRGGVLNTDYLINRFQYSYDLLKGYNIYEREAMVFPNYPYDQESLDYIITWIHNRMDFLDIYFNYNPDFVTEIRHKSFRIYPNPVQDHFSIRSTDNLTGKPFQIIDIQGKIIISGTYNDTPVSVADLGRGFYIFRINGTSEKLVVE